MLPMLRTTWPILMDEFLSNDYLGEFFNGKTVTNAPAVNIIEGKDDFRIEVAAPGLEKKDFVVNLENNVLAISSEKESNKEEDDGKVMRREFNYKSFKRSFTLPNTVDGDKISATHKEGILYITIPKREEAKVKPPRQIDVA
jgi:HSP20 family protein